MSDADSYDNFDQLELEIPILQKMNTVNHDRYDHKNEVKKSVAS